MLLFTSIISKLLIGNHFCSDQISRTFLKSGRFWLFLSRDLWLKKINWMQSIYFMMMKALYSGVVQLSCGNISNHIQIRWCHAVPQSANKTNIEYVRWNNRYYFFDRAQTLPQDGFKLIDIIGPSLRKYLKNEIYQILSLYFREEWMLKHFICIIHIQKIIS